MLPKIYIKYESSIEILLIRNDFYKLMMDESRGIISPSPKGPATTPNYAGEKGFWVQIDAVFYDCFNIRGLLIEREYKSPLSATSRYADRKRSIYDIYESIDRIRIDGLGIDWIIHEENEIISLYQMRDARFGLPVGSSRSVLGPRWICSVASTLLAACSRRMRGHNLMSRY